MWQKNGESDDWVKWDGDNRIIEEERWWKGEREKKLLNKRKKEKKNPPNMERQIPT